MEHPLVAALVALSATAAASPARDVTLTGNQVFDTATLRKALDDATCDGRHKWDSFVSSMHPGANGVPRFDDPAPCDSLEDRVTTIDTFYFVNGYVTTKAAGFIDARGKEVIAIHEDARYAFGAIDIADVSSPSDPLGDPAQLAAYLQPLRPGEPFLRKALWAVMDAVRARYDALGYATATVLPIIHTHTDRKTIDVHVEIDRGRLHKVGAVDVLFAKGARAVALREVVAIRTGTVYRHADVEAARKRLAARFPGVTLHDLYQDQQAAEPLVRLVIRAE